MESPAKAQQVFRRSDRLAFAITSVVVFLVYWFSVGPEVDLENAGMYATAGMYGGVGPSPGYPHWALYAWLFAHGLPFGTIAWRIAISSAVAGAIASGLIGMMGSRTAAAAIAEVIPLVTSRDLKRTSIVSGCVGGMAFAFSTDFWGRAVVADVETFNILLFCIVLALLMRWLFQPTKRSYLYAAFFFYGLTLVSGQSFIATSLGMQLFVVFGNHALGRDLVLVNSGLLLLGLFFKWLGWFPMLQSTVLGLYIGVTAINIMAGTTLVAITRKAFTEWKSVVFACSLLTTGALTYLLVVILSMTNPPATGPTRAPLTASSICSCEDNLNG